MLEVDKAVISTGRAHCESASIFGRNGASTMRRKAKAASGPYLLHVELLRHRVPSFDRFPYCLPAVRNLDRLAFHPKVTFLVGENGTGKSTLLEALALSVGLNPEGGSRNFNFATRASHSDLDGCFRVAKTINHPRDSYFLRAESFYNVATEVERLTPTPVSMSSVQRVSGRCPIRRPSTT